MDLLDQRAREKAAQELAKNKKKFDSYPQQKPGPKKVKFSERFKGNAAAKVRAQNFMPFEEIDLTDLPGNVTTCTRILGNNLYDVEIHLKQTPIGKVELMALSSARPADTRHITWAEKNRIKNEIYGVDRVMLEVYPAAWEGLDDSKFWFWIQPVGVSLPFQVGKNPPPVMEDFEIEFPEPKKEEPRTAKKLILPPGLKK